MSDRYQVEVHRRVYDNETGHYLTVRPAIDCPDGFVTLMTDESEHQHWGELRMEIPAAMARALGQALIAAAGEAGA